MHTTRAIAHQLGAVRHLQGYPLLGYMRLVSHGQGGGVNLQQHDHRQTMFPRCNFHPSLLHHPLCRPRVTRTSLCADPHPRSSLRRSIRLAQTPSWISRITLRWSPANRCQYHRIRLYRRSWLNRSANDGRTLTSAIRRFDRGSDRRGQDRGVPSVTMRSGPLSINCRRAININKMIHAGPTRSTRNREISVRSRFGIYRVFRIYYVRFQPRILRKYDLNFNIDRKSVIIENKRFFNIELTNSIHFLSFH